MEIKCYVVLICCFKDDSAMMGIKDLANDLIIFCPLYLYKDEYNIVLSFLYLYIKMISLMSVLIFCSVFNPFNFCGTVLVTTDKDSKLSVKNIF